MIQGVMSLRCPTCGQPFLTLPQAPEALVTCPHCARSAPTSAYLPAGQVMRGAEALPLRRRASLPRAAGQSLMTHAPSPWQPPPQWPKAPEQPPTAPLGQSGGFGPVPPKVSPFGIAAAQPGALPTAPLEAAFFSPEPAPSWPPPAQHTLGSQTGKMPLKTLLQPQEPSLPPTPPEAQPEMPWPSMGEIRQQPESIWSETPMTASPQVSSEPAAADLLETQSKAPARLTFASFAWLVVLFVASLGLYWQEYGRGWSWEFPAPKIEPQAEPAHAADLVPAEAPPTPVPSVPTPIEPEVRRAQVPDADEKAAMNPTAELLAKTESLLRAFFAASDETGRLSLLTLPEDHTVEVAAFFARGTPVLRSVAFASATPLSLPGGKPVPLFQVVTDHCPTGALLKLSSKEDQELRLDWPLFAETHQLRLANFLETRPETPSWHHVGLRRSHGLDLPAEVRERHLIYDLQGSADGSVRCLAIAARETPLGRFLERETTWGKVYLARLLLQHRQDMSDFEIPHILDCEGARTGASQP